jgi:hypothetical protein
MELELMKSKSGEDSARAQVESLTNIKVKLSEGKHILHPKIAFLNITF